MSAYVVVGDITANGFVEGEEGAEGFPWRKVMESFSAVHTSLISPQNKG